MKQYTEQYIHSLKKRGYNILDGTYLNPNQYTAYKRTKKISIEIRFVITSNKTWDTLKGVEQYIIMSIQRRIYKNGKTHCEYGPAHRFNNPTKNIVKRYWRLNGSNITDMIEALNLSSPMSKADKVLFKLTFL